MATLPKVFSTTQAADALGITDGRVRQILRELDEQKRPLGVKAGRAWLLTEDDVEFLRSLPDHRRKDKKNP